MVLTCIPTIFNALANALLGAIVSECYENWLEKKYQGGNTMKGILFALCLLVVVAVMWCNGSMV